MNGFTEAEKAAMLWRKQQREQENKHKPEAKNSNSVQRTIQRNREITDQRSASDRRRRRSSSPENRHFSRNDMDKRRDFTESSFYDDFGREISREKYMTLEREKRYGQSERGRSRDSDRHGSQTTRRRSGSKERSRSRSRSRSRDKSRNRSRSHDSHCRRSRTRSRSKERRWRHDLYDVVEKDSTERDGERRRDENYRPPSPAWISRAGGVAIMKKRNTDDNKTRHSRPS